MLTATTISFTNEWLHTNTPNFRIVFAGLGASLLFAGLEQLNERAATGVATIALVTILFTPIDGDSPAQTLDKLATGKPIGKAP